MKVKLLGLTNQKNIEKQVQICAAAGKLSRMQGSVFDAINSMKDYDKALKFVERVISMKHTSTIDHDYFVFALSGVTPIVEQTIISERFASFTVKSRREVDFSTVGFYVPNFHNKEGKIIKNNSEMQLKYKKYMKGLFNNYKKLVDNNISKEDARFVLPYSFHGEIIMGLDGTALARMINKLTKGKCSNISELKELGEKLQEIALKRAPYLKVLIDNAEIHNYSEIEQILDGSIEHNNYTLLDKPILLNSYENIDEILFINSIMRIYGYEYVNAKKVYEKNIKGHQEIEEKLMKAIFNDPEHEDLKQINLRFAFSVPFAILTHYTRHRRLSLSIPDFVPNINLEHYITPPSIKNSEFNKFYQEIFKNNKEIYDEFKSLGIRDEDLVYFTLSGNAINVVINFDGEAFRWICRLRECTKAQWCIRENVTKMHSEVSKIANYFAKNLGPDCVTKLKCGEGKESCGRINIILEKLKGEVNE